MDQYLGLFNYWVYVLLMMLGLYAAIAKTNLVKKVIGLSLFQTGIFIFYISLGVVSVEGETGAVPIFHGGHGHAAAEEADAEPRAAGELERHEERGAGERGHAGEAAARPHVYSNPLPHVLILTAIVVSVSTMAVALAIVVNIKRSFGTIESDELSELEGPQDTDRA